VANKIDDLRSHLFETLAALRDKDHPMDLDRARTVADVAKVLVESAKVEVDFLKVTGAVRGTGFLPDEERRGPVPSSRRLDGQEAPPRAVGHRCVLCGCGLTTAYSIERGLCGSCSDRPEAQAALKRKSA
jgi:hypothetical protein